IPADPYMKAKMYQWMFFEQYSHEPFIAVARFINKYLGLPPERIYKIMLYPLNIQMKDQLSNSSEEDTICADWREGELW
ncbi:hypothetical protein ABLU05_14770, partial [Acinetobacter baumannii]